MKKITIFIVFFIGLISLLSSCKKGTFIERDDSKRAMDMIVWYDIDHGSKNKNNIGWWPLNPQHPNTVKASGSYRSTTPLLGLYDIGKEETVRQHLYWFAAIGANAVTGDWTNYTNDPKDQNKEYNKDIYLNTENFLKTITKMQKENDFPIATFYPTIRLFDEDYERLELVVEDVYRLYEENPSAWYKFDGSDKPFLVIFADTHLLNSEWENESQIPFDDSRFDIRWSNGHLLASSIEDKNGRYRLPKEKPYWYFVEEALDEKEGYYKVFYKEGKDKKVEQMMAWVALYKGWTRKEGSSWAGMDQIYDGKTNFERTLKDVKRLSPKALLVNRFNYPSAWNTHPYEGLSLYEGTHFEPNRDIGFEIFNNVMVNLYDMNNWEGQVPANPMPEKLDEITYRISFNGYPLEYRISNNVDFEGATWVYLNINDWISIEEYDTSILYIQTRNAFGQSDITEFNIN